MAINARNITDDEFFFGHKACAGCGGSLVVVIRSRCWVPTPLLRFLRAA